MSKAPRKMTYARDLLGRDGRQFVLPWGPGKTVSTIQAGKRLGICYDTIGQMCESGELQGWRIRDKKKSPWRVCVQSIEDYRARLIAKFSTTDPEPKPQPSQPTQRTQPTRPVR